jgi:hypothetical protein
MFIPGAIDVIGAGVADATGRGGPEFVAGGELLGAIVMPGIGAIVGDGDAFAAAGLGVVFFAGGLAIGIPAMGTVAGGAAAPGDAANARPKAKANAVTARRTASTGTYLEMDGHTTFRSTLPQTPVAHPPFQRRTPPHGA